MAQLSLAAPGAARRAWPGALQTQQQRPPWALRLPTCKASLQGNSQPASHLYTSPVQRCAKSPRFTRYVPGMEGAAYQLPSASCTCGAWGAKCRWGQATASSALLANLQLRLSCHRAWQGKQAA